jgi:hypothetical protein
MHQQLSHLARVPADNGAVKVQVLESRIAADFEPVGTAQAPCRSVASAFLGRMIWSMTSAPVVNTSRNSARPPPALWAATTGSVVS